MIQQDDSFDFVGAYINQTPQPEPSLEKSQDNRRQVEESNNNSEYDDFQIFDIEPSFHGLGQIDSYNENLQSQENPKSTGQTFDRQAILESQLFNNSEFQKTNCTCLRKEKKIDKKTKGKCKSKGKGKGKGSKKNDQSFRCGKNTENDSDWRNFLPYIKRKILNFFKNQGLQDEPSLKIFYSNRGKTSKEQFNLELIRNSNQRVVEKLVQLFDSRQTIREIAFSRLNLEQKMAYIKMTRKLHINFSEGSEITTLV